MNQKVTLIVEQIKSLSNDEIKLLERFLTYGKSKYGGITPLHINPTHDEILTEISSSGYCRIVVVMEDHITPDGKQLKADDILVFKYGGEVLHSDIVKQFNLSFTNTLLLEYESNRFFVTISMPTSHKFYHNPEIVSYIRSNINIANMVGGDIDRIAINYFDEKRIGKWEDTFKSGAEKLSIGETIYNYVVTYDKRFSEKDKILVVNYIKSILDESVEYIKGEIETLLRLINTKRQKIAKERGIENINQIRFDSDKDLNDLKKLLEVAHLLLLYKETEEEFWWKVNL